MRVFIFHDHGESRTVLKFCTGKIQPGRRFQSRGIAEGQEEHFGRSKDEDRIPQTGTRLPAARLAATLRRAEKDGSSASRVV